MMSKPNTVLTVSTTAVRSELLRRAVDPHQPAPLGGSPGVGSGAGVRLSDQGRGAVDWFDFTFLAFPPNCYADRRTAHGCLSS
jgi:hypothetical protein